MVVIALVYLIFLYSVLFDKDAGHKVFLEEVYELQGRLPGGNWGPSSVPWTDVVSAVSWLDEVDRPSFFFLEHRSTLLVKKRLIKII
jgi:hypothetical protein